MDEYQLADFKIASNLIKTSFAQADMIENNLRTAEKYLMRSGMGSLKFETKRQANRLKEYTQNAKIVAKEMAQVIYHLSDGETEEALNNADIIEDVFRVVINRIDESNYKEMMNVLKCRFVNKERIFEH